MRGKKKIAVRIAAAFTCACCLLNVVAPVNAQDGKPDGKTIMETGLIYFLMSCGISMGDISKVVDDAWPTISALWETYVQAQSIDIDKLQTEIQVTKNNTITYGSDVANVFTSFVNWLKTEKSVKDQSVTYLATSENAQYITASANVPYAIYTLNGKTLYIATDVPANIAICYYTRQSTPKIIEADYINIWTSDNSNNFSISVSGDAEVVDGVTKQDTLTIHQTVSDTNIKLYYYTLWPVHGNNPYTDVTHIYIPAMEHPLIYNNAWPLLQIYGKSVESSKMLSVAVPNAINNPSSISSDKEYEIDLSRLKNIDIWKDEVIHSIDDATNALEKAIENQKTVTIGLATYPVAWPLADEKEQAIAVGKVKDIPVPTAVPTAVPTDPAVPVPVIPVIPDDPDAYKLPALSTVFPFSVPFDLFKAFTVLNADPVAPSWNMKILGKDYNFDLSFLNPYIGVIHAAVVLLFVVGLIFITRYFVGGQ